MDESTTTPAQTTSDAARGAPARSRWFRTSRDDRIHRVDGVKVGLVAGWGRYPLLVAEALQRQGYHTYCLAIKDHADPQLAELCAEIEWCGMARLGQARRFFRRHGVQRLTMAGKIHKVKLYEPAWLWRHRPDWRTLSRFWSHFIVHRADRKDDTLLGAVIEELTMDGATMSPATDFVPQLLAPEGVLTRRAPSAIQQRDIEFGWPIAKQMGGLDVGQSVVIKHRSVIAVEAIEGTDECIARAGKLCPIGGFTVVKVAKPQQDMRFDVPTVGLQTLQTMQAAGGSVLAIEAGRTILLDQTAMLRYADEHKLAIVSRPG